MEYDNKVTLEFDPFQMEIIRFSAMVRNMSPAQFLKEQLNIESTENWLLKFMLDASQGRMSHVTHQRCENCQYMTLLGEGADVCFRCDHDFPEPCSDQVHATFAMGRQSSEDKNFHCKICNKWIVASNLKVETETPIHAVHNPSLEPGRYFIKLDDTSFKVVEFFVNEVLTEHCQDLAQRIWTNMNTHHQSIWAIDRKDLDMLKSSLTQYVEYLQRPNDIVSVPERQRTDRIIECANHAIEIFDQAIEDQRPAYQQAAA